jgi:hypothetical protein
MVAKGTRGRRKGKKEESPGDQLKARSGEENN